MLETQSCRCCGYSGDEVAQVFADLHVEHGVDLRCGVTGFIGAPARSDDVGGVQLADGTTLAPTSSLSAWASGRTSSSPRTPGSVDNGILVTGTCAPPMTTSAPPATSPTPTTRCWPHLRVEHWANALNGGPSPPTMLGKPEDYDRLPYFFTDQYDLGMEYTGYRPAAMTRSCSAAT